MSHAIGLVWLLVAVEVGPPAVNAPLTLAQAVEEAAAHSPAARRARLTWAAAAAAADQTRPRLRPDLTVTAATALNTPAVHDPAFPHALVRRDFSARVELSARQTLWHFGGAALNRRAAAASAAAEADHQAALASLRHDVALAYFDLLAAQGGLALAAEGVRRAESQMARVKDLVSLQKVADVDQLQAEAGLLEAQAARVQAAGGLALATANLNRLLGRADLTQALVIAPVAELPPPLPPVADAVRYALDHRPEVVALVCRQQEALAGGQWARADRQPTLDLAGNLAAGTKTAFGPAAEAGVGLELRWPLSRMDDAAGRQAVAAETGAKVLDAALEELRAGVALEVHRAWRDEQTARERYALAEARAATTTEAHRVKLLQYDRQRCTLLDVQGALLERARAEMERDQARYAIHRAVAAFELATARTWAPLGPAPAPQP